MNETSVGIETQTYQFPDPTMQTLILSVAMVIPFECVCGWFRLVLDDGELFALSCRETRESHPDQNHHRVFVYFCSLFVGRTITIIVCYVTAELLQNPRAMALRRKCDATPKVHSHDQKCIRCKDGFHTSIVLTSVCGRLDDLFSLHKSLFVCVCVFMGLCNLHGPIHVRKM